MTGRVVIADASFEFDIVKNQSLNRKEATAECPGNRKVEAILGIRFLGACQ